MRRHLYNKSNLHLCMMFSDLTETNKQYIHMVELLINCFGESIYVSSIYHLCTIESVARLVQMLRERESN